MSSKTIYSIYSIINQVNQKVYIGWTSRDPESRFHEHQSTRKPKYQERSAISYAIEKYGIDNFTFQVIYQSLDYDHSRQIESHFISEYQSLVEQHGYNKDFGGTGHKRTQATIEKHRAKIKGRSQTAEHKAKRARSGKDNPMYGKSGELSPRYGKTFTEESKKKISEGIKQAYASGKCIHPRLNCVLSQDSKNKMKETKRLRKLACEELDIPYTKLKTPEEEKLIKETMELLRNNQ